MSAMKYEKSFLDDPFMADELEKVPGGDFIEYSQIKRYLNNEPFVIMTDNGEEQIDHNLELVWAFNYYFEIFDNCERFGLPNGGDWTKNPPWLIELIKMFDLCKKQVESYLSERVNSGFKY